MIYYRYLGRLYLKYFAVIFLALTLFFVGLDFLQSFKSLPDSANLQVLYVMYKAFYGADMLLPISLIFGMISAKVYLIRSNELVAFYSVGYDRKRVIKPFFISSVILLFFYIVLHATPFAYSSEYADSIKKNSYFTDSTTNLFFKYYDNYIYFEKLYPLQKRAENIRIFKVENDVLKEIIKAKEAFFDQNLWKIRNATVVNYKKNQDGSNIEVSQKSELKLLEGFRPKILDTIYEGKTSFSIIDAIEAIILLSKQNVNTDKIKSILYSQLVYPFFAPFLLVILFYFVPISRRFASITLFGFMAILTTLIVWGLLFALSKLSLTGVLPPELAVLFPVSLLGAGAFYLYSRF
ncbi:LptF/LptG family permease [Nitrosophilus alvini]|uniref:LptF/LptG family permease n=1 Tax=Nitrosophilus alvini TaxID=2714855 RepID=UPI0019090C6D|nr:LptF/LptG family permease [Nitrosophilus alvini]